MDSKAEIDFVKTITLAIEANLYHKFNRNVGKTSEYTQRSRFIVLNLKHERNFDLRLKILLEDISPSELAGMGEDELAPKSVHNERQQKQQEFFNAREITDDFKVLAKSHKGDLDIGDIEEQKIKLAPPVALDNNNGDTSSNKRAEGKKSIGKASDTDKNGKNSETEELAKVIDKDIQEMMNGVSYEDFKIKCLDRYSKYLPKEIAEELEQALI